jgi:aspartyl-tRNA(Asn)/glutamyl-tRNA(Gln) amidotransferase subunit C
MTDQPFQRLSTDEVRQVASLCHIALTDAEVERLCQEMATLLNEVSVLQAIDTTDVDPTGHAVENVRTVMREDNPRDPLAREDVLSNVPLRDGDFIRVRAIMESS